MQAIMKAGKAIMNAGNYESRQSNQKARAQI
jgi:hypothetical protein